MTPQLERASESPGELVTTHTAERHSQSCDAVAWRGPTFYISAKCPGDADAVVQGGQRVTILGPPHNILESLALFP